jgi:hypothetical protein
MTYPQASELTIPQLLHALSINPRAPTDAQLRAEQQARQHEIFDRIAARLNKLPSALARLPLEDLAAQVQLETAGQRPPLEQFAESLERYAQPR